MNINVKNLNSRRVVIDIEGVIGLNEELQFAEDDSTARVSTYEKFRSEIEDISQSDIDNLRINIRSMGGSVQDALLIYEAICSLGEGVKVQTYCYGFSASAATIIAQAASPGERYVSNSALYMIHKASTQFDGNADEASSVVEMLEKTDRNIAEIYALRSGLEVDHFLEIMSREGGVGQWLTAEEAVEAGLADKIETFSSLKNVMNSIKDFFGQFLTPHSASNANNTATDKALQETQPLIVIDTQSTETTSREDPIISHQLVPLSQNKNSYSKDVELFKGR